jgi:alpha-tubulin suppressor-like RCC1 family protein
MLFHEDRMLPYTLNQETAVLFAAPIVVQFKDASPKLVDVACGNNHTVVMSEEGQLFSWGFGASCFPLKSSLMLYVVLRY